VSHKLAILASGAGSNARNILNYFKDRKDVEVVLIACNKEGAGVFDIAAQHHIPTFLLNKNNFAHGDAFLHELHRRKVDFVVLAGFLWKVPAHLVAAYPQRIVNIHPALLPKYGGKGMYGHFVHEAVHANKEKESGITIHYVNEQYDEGAIIFQARAGIAETDGPAEIEQKVRALEMQHFPRVIDEVLHR
jgi:phosphoribosylglycinamide formyltransferase-1